MFRIPVSDRPDAPPIAYSPDGAIRADGRLHRTGRRLGDATAAGAGTMLGLDDGGETAAITYLDALDKMSQSAVVLVFTIFDYFHHNYDSETSIELTKMVLDMRHPKA